MLPLYKLYSCLRIHSPIFSFTFSFISYLCVLIGFKINPIILITMGDIMLYVRTFFIRKEVCIYQIYFNPFRALDFVKS